jgi:hypothetical protein
LSYVSQINNEFTGTVALRNEKLTLPDGSKVAIGIDGPHWVLVFQQSSNSPVIMYEYNMNKQTVIVDKKLGKSEDLNKIKDIINYFFNNAKTEDLVTIEPGVAV